MKGLTSLLSLILIMGLCLACVGGPETAPETTPVIVDESPGPEEEPAATEKPAATEPPALPAPEVQLYQLPGVWQFENPGFEEVTIQFTAEGRVVMVFSPDNQVTGAYRIDYTTDPINLDIDWDGNAPFVTIIRFLDDTKMQMENNDVLFERPQDFSENSFILLRLE